MATSMRSCSMRQTVPRCPGAPRVATRPSLVRPARGVSVHSQAPAASAADLSKWSIVYEALKKENLRSIGPQEAKARADTGKWVLVDVRLPEQYDEAHAEGALNVPMYKTINLQGASGGQLLKFMLYKANGVNPIDVNAEFDAELAAATAGGTKSAVFMCEAGGTMVGSVNFPLGKSSRSLQAVYKALKGGFNVSQLAHLGGGLYAWSQMQLPMVGDYVPDIGRTPAAAPAPTLPGGAGGAKKEEEPKKKGFFGF